MKKILDSDWLRAVQFFWKIKEIKWDLCILIGLETVTIVSANRIKVAAIETKKPQLCESSQ